MTPADRLAAYRSRHRIEPEPDGQGGQRCAVDGIKLVHTAHRLWHDIPEARALAASVPVPMSAMRGGR
jgi:hypothetical protein